MHTQKWQKTPIHKKDKIKEKHAYSKKEKFYTNASTHKDKRETHTNTRMHKDKKRQNTQK